MWTVWSLAAFAVLMDVFFFAVPVLRPLTWANYLFVWLAVHQLGYAWRDGLQGGGRSLAWGLMGLGLLVALVSFGPYPLSLVGVPGQVTADGAILSNTRPPKLPLLALGVAQIGLLLSLQGPANRFLAKRKAWAATVLANGMIMTVFLWHSTAMMLLFGLGFLLGTFPFVLGFQRFERVSVRPPVSLVRLALGCCTACYGLALLAIGGINEEGTTTLRGMALLMVFAGCGLAGFGPIGAALAKLSPAKPSA
ncbi:MAG: hypothetical protein ACI82G_002320 [Bradymonadia bacterium]|jgi:hypothetical protein